MNQVAILIEQVSRERKTYLEQLMHISEAQAHWKQKEDDWHIAEITEHLFWAEHGGIFGMWNTLKGIRDGKLTRTVESVHKNLPIEQIIQLTWRPKEIVPPVAAPRLGGPLSFWIASLASLQQILDAFGQDLQADELRIQAHPHPISGPMDFQQRLEFLGFHIARHRMQCANILDELNQLK